MKLRFSEPGFVALLLASGACRGGAPVEPPARADAVRASPSPSTPPPPDPSPAPIDERDAAPSARDHEPRGWLDRTIAADSYFAARPEAVRKWVGEAVWRCAIAEAPTCNTKGSPPAVTSRDEFRCERLCSLLEVAPRLLFEPGEMMPQETRTLDVCVDAFLSKGTAHRCDLGVAPDKRVQKRCDRECELRASAALREQSVPLPPGGRIHPR